MSKIIAVSNQKGGVSKTTSTYNLGACLSHKYNKKVLLIDIDPQANLSEYLEYEPDGTETMTQLIMSACMTGSVSCDMVKSTIRHCDAAKVDYIPSDINLASSESLMTTALSRETILKRILTEDITKEYDYVIIDCLPSLGTLLINALAASDNVLIPVQTQKFSMDGLQALEALIKQIRNTINPDLRIIGILPTMTDRTLISRTAMTTLEEIYGELLFETSISKSIEAAKSSENKKPLCCIDCKLATEYNSLAWEVLKR